MGRFARTLWLLLGASTAEAFAPLPFRALTLTSTSRHASDQANSYYSDDFDHRRVLLLDWDGCLIDTVDWRIRVGLQAAARTWPTHVLLPDDATWLYNKLASLAHVLESNDNNSISATVEYAVCTRLLLEEQRLDRGRSVGKSGKYSRQFHPQSHDTTTLMDVTTNNNNNNNVQSSRPLTVGEIAQNWAECLRDAALLRYAVETPPPNDNSQRSAVPQNPLPILQRAVDEILLSATDEKNTDDNDKASSFALPHFNTTVLQTLQSSLPSHCRVVVMAQESEMELVRKRLAEALDDDVDSIPIDGDNTNQKWSVRCRSKNTLPRIIEEHGTTNQNQRLLVDVVESASWSRLRAVVPYLQDHDVPDPEGWVRIHGARARLSMAAPWAKPSLHPTIEMEATMNPWTNVCSLEDLVERIRRDSADAILPLQ